MPELPSELRDRIQSEYGLAQEEARKLSSVKERASLFEEIVREGLDPKLVSTFVVDTLVGELKYRDMKIDGFKSDGVVDILKDYTDDKITWDILEDILRKSLDDDDSVSKIYEDYDHSTIEEDDLYYICREVIGEEKSAVEDYKEGDDSAINYLIGKVKKKTDGSADAKETRKILKEIIQK
jgi:aspartyl-tRNA(Asn)/glutamyl-tRNA(Gln) amidotransferase subunit B